MKFKIVIEFEYDIDQDIYEDYTPEEAFQQEVIDLKELPTTEKFESLECLYEGADKREIILHLMNEDVSVLEETVEED